MENYDSDPRVLSLPTPLYRRLAKLQFMVWQVVWYCAAARGSRTAADGSKWKRAQPAKIWKRQGGWVDFGARM